MRPSRHPGASRRHLSNVEQPSDSSRPVIPALPVAATQSEILDSAPTPSQGPRGPRGRGYPRRRPWLYAADFVLRSYLSDRATWTAPQPWSHFPHQLGPDNRELSVRRLFLARRPPWEPPAAAHLRPVPPAWPAIFAPDRSTVRTCCSTLRRRCASRRIRDEAPRCI